MTARRAIIQAATTEYLRHDSRLIRTPVALSAYSAASAMTHSKSLQRRARGFDLLMRLHAAAISPSVDGKILRRLREATAAEWKGKPTGLWESYDAAIRRATAPDAAFQASKPGKYVGTRILVVKAARAGERGVLIVDYSNVFPILAGKFDLHAIAERYTIVLEPSWTGLSQPDVMLFTRLKQRVFVQTMEPRDREFIEALGANLTVVPIAANWWVDPRTLPDPPPTRDIDVIMVASWADWKRHWRFFRALAALRKRGHTFKVALVGYNYGWTRQDIEAQAEHYGIRDQVEIFERISTEEVWKLLLRSKIHVLWSRREGSNRAIIEAMTADVPVIVREGLSFGFKYPYINEKTGRFVRDGELADAMLDMITSRQRYAPREWIVQNMTCHTATDVLERQLQAAARAANDPWSGGIVRKTSGLDGQHYVNPADRELFADDYRFLESTILKNG